jgi:chromosome segregation protein
VKNGNAGVIGQALDIVRVKGDYRNVAQYLLGDVVIVDTMETALSVWKKNGTHKTLVTLSGEIVDPWGAVTGGAVEAGGTGMLRTRREIKDLEREVETLTGQAASLETDLRATESAIEADDAAVQDLSSRIHRAELDLVSLEKERAGVADELDRFERRQQTVTEETARHAAQRDELGAELEQATAQLLNLENGHSNAQTSIGLLLQELSRERELLDASRSVITEIKMELSALLEKQAGIAKQLEALDHTEADLRERKFLRDEEISSIAVKVRELEEGIAAAELAIQDHIRTLEMHQKELAVRQEAHAERSQTLHALEEQARGTRHEVEAVQKKLSAIEVRRTELG